MSKNLVGLVEKVKIIGEKEVETYALFDSGAKNTSIDISLSDKAKLGPIIKMVKIKNPSLKTKVTRPVVRAVIEIHGRKFDVQVNLQDRSHMKFPIIIGRNIMSGNFLIDPEKGEDIWDRIKPGSDL